MKLAFTVFCAVLSLSWNCTALIARAADPTTDTNYIAKPPKFSELSYEDADKAVDGIIDSVVAEKLKTVGPEFCAYTC